MIPDEQATTGDPEDLCPYGCYWDCEHRVSVERARLFPVEDPVTGNPASRCRECGDFFHDWVAHGREHHRLRQLGWLPERLPKGWPGQPRLG